MRQDGSLRRSRQSGRHRTAPAPAQPGPTQTLDPGPWRPTTLLLLPIPAGPRSPAEWPQSASSGLQASGPLSVATLAAFGEEQAPKHVCSTTTLGLGGPEPEGAQTHTKGCPRAHGLFPGQRRASRQHLERRRHRSRSTLPLEHRSAHLLADCLAGARHPRHSPGANRRTQGSLPRHRLGRPRQLRRRLRHRIPLCNRSRATPGCRRSHP